MRTVVLSALLVGFVIPCGIADEEYTAACDYSETLQGRFSSPDADDTLFVSVSGSPCYSGRLRIAIQDSKGQLLYEYEASMPSLTPPLETDEALHAFARTLIKNTINRAFSQDSGSLPPYNEVPGRERVVVSQAKYESIRTRALPIFSHSGAEESWRVVVYDPESSIAIVVLGGAL